MRFLSLILGIMIAGCGGTQLTPAQQDEFNSLGAKESALRGQIAQSRAKEGSTFKRLGKLEAKQKAVAKLALGCGVKASNDSFGPLPFVHKKGYRVKLVAGSKRTIGGKKCLEYKLKVVK